MNKNCSFFNRKSHFTLIELLVDTFISSMRFFKCGDQRKLQNTPLFLKEKGGAGERGNFFSREKKFPLSPAHTPFTLIELLVVIAIIAILAAILLPALQSARDRGITANCLSNQREAGKYFHQYYSDYTTAVPNIVPVNQDVRNWGNHLTLLYGNPSYDSKNNYWTRHSSRRIPMLTNTPFQCPSQVSTNPATKGVNSNSYGLNPYICNFYDNSSGKKKYTYSAPRILLHKDKHPAKRLCAYEWGSSAIVTNNSNTYNLLSSSCRLSKNHTQRKSVNYLFMDAHAENRRGRESTNVYIYQKYDL